jgi:hypothetical protein
MGEFNARISQMSDEELLNVWQTIDKYQAAFIEDFVLELDKRNKVVDFFLMHSSERLIKICLLLDTIQQSKAKLIFLYHFESKNITNWYNTDKENLNKKTSNEIKINKTQTKAIVMIIILLAIFYVRNNKKTDIKNGVTDNEIINNQIKSEQFLSNQKQLDFNQFKDETINNMIYKSDGILYKRLRDFENFVIEFNSDSIVFSENDINDIMKKEKNGISNLILDSKKISLSDYQINQLKDEINYTYSFELKKILNNITFKN